MVAKFRQQAGDTIVEVLIATMVISTVLAGAFVVSRTSLTNVRNSEEHSQALKILQGQLEQLRANISTAPAGNFCFEAVPNPANPDSPFDLTPPCEVGDIPYNVTIRNIPGGPPGTARYEGTIQWTAINGRASQEQLVYSVVK